MANPEYQDTLDVLDKLSVCFYRLGISLFAFSLFLLGLNFLHRMPQTGVSLHSSIVIAFISSIICAANIHVYSKVIRFVIQWSTWVSAILIVADYHWQFWWLTLGFIFVTFSGIALKESFCFRVIGLKTIPLFLAPSVLLIFFQWFEIAGILLLLSGVIFTFLSLAKWRMPLHFDIGIKNNYEI
ncbi:hypothetical protein F9817_01340 [Vibrio sp. CAIM 722]|uniref:Integral membrane protein n=1 Tax=Vibrio eleionomae TaxID=2653505 RepID=A0A7X4LH51_9VIBR|nr:DUF2301 domain-containing membrane protein [Vibrio eleionomae]MZI91849.1 hypothetical protein [Vibrio eleionomae]